MDRPRSNSSGFEPGQFDRTTDPPPASGRRVERVLPIAIVAQQADAAAQIERRLGVGDRVDEQLLELHDARFIDARFLREREELVAMVEGEGEHFVVSWCAARSRGAGA